MTANINGFARRNGTTPPWHGIGKTVDSNATADQWAKSAGFDWEVIKSDVFYRSGNSAHTTPKHQVFFRSDNPDVVLGVNSDRFVETQPREFLDFMYQFSQETNTPMETLGMLGEGEKFFALLNTGENKEIVPGEGPTKRYILGASANDGGLSTKFTDTDVRVVCQNTLSLALSRAMDTLSIPHRTTINWKKVRSYLDRGQEDFELYGELMHQLFRIPINTEQASDFVKELLIPHWDPQKATRKPHSVEKFANTLNTAPGQKEAGQTAYGLIQAVTRYVDHDKQARNQESRLNAAWFGQGRAMKSRAFDILLKDCVTKWGARDQLVPVLAETRYNKLIA